MTASGLEKIKTSLSHSIGVSEHNALIIYVQFIIIYVVFFLAFVFAIFYNQITNLLISLEKYLVWCLFESE